MEITRDIASTRYHTEDFEVLLEDLLTEIRTRNYRVTRINHIDNIHDRREAGIDVTIGFKHYKIVEFCNLNSCSELISADLSSGVFMPVKFVVYQENEQDEVTIAFLKPTAFAALYQSESLTRVAADLEKDMTEILDEMGY